MNRGRTARQVSNGEGSYRHARTRRPVSVAGVLMLASHMYCEHLAAVIVELCLGILLDLA